MSEDCSYDSPLSSSPMKEMIEVDGCIVRKVKEMLQCSCHARLTDMWSQSSLQHSAIQSWACIEGG